MKNYCPHCKSDNFIYSKKSNRYLCADCCEFFDTPDMSHKPKLFLSYGHKQSAIAERIKNYLEDNGYEVWMDSQINTFDDWREKITNGIFESDHVLSLASRYAWRDKGVCLDELKIAICLKRAYVYVVLLEKMEDSEIPAFISHNQRLDMSKWNAPEKDENEYFFESMESLLKGLHRKEVRDWEEQMRFLSDKMSVLYNTIKEDLLSEKLFIGRKWLRDEVNAWLVDPTQNVFTIYGVPGAGKSAFTANLVLNIPEIFASVFFKWNSQTSKDPDRFTRLLALKLAENLTGYRESLYGIYKNEPSVNDLSGQDLFETIVLNPLIRFIDGNHETGTIVFDGLDEASKEIVDLLTNNIDAFPNRVKLLFTSRRTPDITSRLDNYKNIAIEKSEEQNVKDIKEYLAKRLNLDENSPEIEEIANKTEGSFMYAVTFCDSVKNGRIDLSDTSALPSGLNSFYRVFFDRLFPNAKDYISVRPFLELLCTEDDIPAEVVAECLEIDGNDMQALLKKLGSLIITTVAPFSPFNNNAIEKILPNNLKIFRFAHQSIKEWLTDPKSANDYYIIPSKGYKVLAEHYENLPERAPDDEDDEDDTKYIDFLIALGNYDDDPENAENPYLPFHDDALKKFGDEHYIKWLIRGEEYDKARKLLLNSFSSRIGFSGPPDCQALLPLWQWADMFPRTESVTTLVNKLKDLIRITNEFTETDPGYRGSLTPYSWRNILFCFVILSKIMDSGRFAPVFFEAVRRLSPYLLAEFKGDDEFIEYQKGYAAYCAAECLKKLDAKRVTVSEDVREICNALIARYPQEN